jgi:hypothetical protein
MGDCPCVLEGVPGWKCNPAMSGREDPCRGELENEGARLARGAPDPEELEGVRWGWT